MKRTILIVVITVMMGSVLFAKHSDEFMVSTYSNITNGWPFFFRNRELLCKYMNEMGYNSNIMVTDKKETDLASLLTIMDNYKLDAWVTDSAFLTDLSSPYRYAVGPYTTSSHSRFEAEYVDESDVNPGDGTNSRFWYAARNDENIKRTGKSVASTDASNGHAWVVKRDTDKPGHTFGDLRYRWPNMNGAYNRFGNEFQVYQKNHPNYQGDYFWFTYRIKVSNLAPNLDPSMPVLNFNISGYELVKGSYVAKATPLKISYGDVTKEEVILTSEDISKLNIKDGFIELVLKVGYKELIDSGLLSADLDNNPSTDRSYTQMRLLNLNPHLYWHGNCDLELDYIEIRDQFNHDLFYERDKWAPKIVDRAKKIIAQGKGNVSGFYAFDEPYQGQFDSFRIMQDILGQEGLSMFTATYDYQHRNITINASKSQYYNHLEAFQDVVKPKIFAPDIYPITPDVKFNPSPTAKQNDLFIQNVIDDKMLGIYRMGKNYTMQEADRRFYPIVQVFGRWAKGAKKDYWTSWLMPPYATQKALLYLPLCFGADGVIHYRVQSYQTVDGYGDYVGLIAYQRDKEIDTPIVMQPTMNAVLDTNPKVFIYGKQLKQMKWLGSNTIMTAGSKTTSPLPPQVMVKSAYVQDDKSAHYAGYIQSGYYLDNSDNPYLMLVNRRGNYFVPATQLGEVNVHATEYDTHFPQAKAQTIVMTLDKAALKRYGSYAGFYDSADSVLYFPNDDVLSIEIEAGEGKLLQMTGTLPPTVKGKAKLPGKAILSGKIELGKGASLILSKDSDIVLLPGTQLITNDRSSIVLDGKIQLMGDAVIVVNGKIKEKSPEISSAPTAQFVKNQPKRRSFFKRFFSCK